MLNYHQMLATNKIILNFNKFLIVPDMARYAVKG